MQPRARIFQPPRSAMQSGTAGTAQWLLTYGTDQPRRPDALMGWSGGADTQSQVRLRFDTREEAVAYAEANGLAYDVEIAQERRIRPKAYADNFKFTRWANWTH